MSSFLSAWKIRDFLIRFAEPTMQHKAERKQDYEKEKNKRNRYSGKNLIPHKRSNHPAVCDNGHEFLSSYKGRIDRHGCGRGPDGGGHFRESD